MRGIIKSWKEGRRATGEKNRIERVRVEKGLVRRKDVKEGRGSEREGRRKIREE